MRRFLVWATATLVVVALLGLGGVGWYYSGEILDVEAPGDPDRSTEVLRIAEGRVTLEDTPEARRRGTWGLDAPEAYAQAGRILRRDAAGITRRLMPIDGRLQQGDVVDVDGYAYPQDPLAAFDFAVSEVDIDAPLGEQPAWYAPGAGGRWAVLVHGRGAQRNECFRLLEILRTDHGFSGLCPTYRNDPGGPDDPADIYRQGEQEWRDVEPAVRYALDQGAEHLLLVGFSMGGQITANFLRHSKLSDEVDAVIWDAPLLDWGPVIAAGAADRGVPGWLVPIGMQASEWRAGVDYADLNQVTHAEAFTVPTLLLHGAADETIPVATSQSFAKARPDIVTFERFPRAGHVEAWNTDRPRYEEAVNRFVDQHFAGG